MSDKNRTIVTTIETHEVWIIGRATVPELPDESALTTGVHTIQGIKFSNAMTADPAIDATPTDRSDDRQSVSPDRRGNRRLAFQPCHHVAQQGRLANQGHAVRRQHAYCVHRAEVKAEGSNQLKKGTKLKEVNMKKNFLKTIVGAVLAVSTLAVLPQIWASAREFGKAESTPKFTEGKGAGNPAFLFAQGNGCESEECRREVAAARIGTAQYHDINVALADGFLQDSPCVRRAGVGTMGFHYALASRIDQIIDPSEPEVLLYLPNDDGVLELVAVEYIFPNVGVVPSLFGQDYLFSAARNRYELHAWIWRHNPAGMFENFNPKLNCPGFPPF